MQSLWTPTAVKQQKKKMWQGPDVRVVFSGTCRMRSWFIFNKFARFKYVISGVLWLVRSRLTQTLVVQISLNCDPFSRSHMTTCRKCSWTFHGRTAWVRWASFKRAAVVRLMCVNRFNSLCFPYSQHWKDPNRQCVTPSVSTSQLPYALKVFARECVLLLLKKG